MLARDRAPRPFYSRTTKLVNAWKVLPCCRQTAPGARAASREQRRLAQIPAGGGIAAPRKTAPGRPGRVPRIPREGSRAALATAAARATAATTMSHLNEGRKRGDLEHRHGVAAPSPLIKLIVIRVEPPLALIRDWQNKQSHGKEA